MNTDELNAVLAATTPSGTVTSSAVWPIKEDVQTKAKGHAFPQSLETGFGFGQQGMASGISTMPSMVTAGAIADGTIAASAADMLAGANIIPMKAARIAMRCRALSMTIVLS